MTISRRTLLQAGAGAVFGAAMAPDAALASTVSTVIAVASVGAASSTKGADAYRQLAKEVLTRWPAE